MNKDEAAADFLLENGADVNLPTNKRNWTPLMYAAALGDEAEASNYIVESCVLDLYDDSSSSDTLHSFDFRAAIHNMCILIYYTNKKISEYDA